MTTTRQWVGAPKFESDDYLRAWEQRPPGRAPLDIYRGDGQPILFQHIRKTAGTSLRHLLFENHRGCDLEIVPIDETPEAVAEFWRTLPDRDRVVCVAGHSANLLLPHLTARPITLVRDPVDRCVSRFYFGGRKSWTLEQLVVDGAIEARFPTSIIPDSLKRFYFNGQSKDLLAPHYDLTGFPNEPDAVWEDRLFRVAKTYLVGTQERLAESVAMFADAFGWELRYVPAMRVNETRPLLDALPARVRRGLKDRNWLDRKLHRWATKRLDAR